VDVTQQPSGARARQSGEAVARGRRRQVSPWTLGGLGPRELGRRVWEALFRHEILDRAAALSYYFVFALFPLLLFVTTLVGLLPITGLLDRLLAYGETVLPDDVASLLYRTLAEIREGARGGLLSLSALGALWGASRGMQSIITTLNVVYAVENPRPWWRRQLVAIGLTLAFSVFMLCAVAFLIFGQRLGAGVAAWVGLGDVFADAWRIVQWPLGILFLLIGIDLTYHLAPAVRQRWYWLTPGSAFAVAAWVLTSLGLRLYVTYFGNYNAMYGSIGAVILLLLWFYLSGLALLIGGEINSAIARAAADRGEEVAVPLADEPPTAAPARAD
jgi:membrane protein